MTTGWLMSSKPIFLSHKFLSWIKSYSQQRRDKFFVYLIPLPNYFPLRFFHLPPTPTLIIKKTVWCCVYIEPQATKEVRKNERFYLRHENIYFTERTPENDIFPLFFS